MVDHAQLSLTLKQGTRCFMDLTAVSTASLSFTQFAERTILRTSASSETKSTY